MTNTNKTLSWYGLDPSYKGINNNYCYLTIFDTTKLFKAALSV